MNGLDFNIILNFLLTVVITVLGFSLNRWSSEAKEREKEQKEEKKELNKNISDLTFEVKRANEKLDNQTIKNEQIYKNKEDIIELNKRVDYLEEKR